jgi:hypothetical protein
MAIGPLRTNIDLSVRGGYYEIGVQQGVSEYMRSSGDMQTWQNELDAKCDGGIS